MPRRVSIWIIGRRIEVASLQIPQNSVCGPRAGTVPQSGMSGSGEGGILRRGERGAEFGDDGGDVIGREGHCRKLPAVGKWAASRVILDCLPDNDLTLATPPGRGRRLFPPGRGSIQAPTQSPSLCSAHARRLAAFSDPVPWIGWRFRQPNASAQAKADTFLASIAATKSLRPASRSFRIRYSRLLPRWPDIGAVYTRFWNPRNCRKIRDRFCIWVPPE